MEFLFQVRSSVPTLWACDRVPPSGDLGLERDVCPGCICLVLCLHHAQRWTASIHHVPGLFRSKPKYFSKPSISVPGSDTQRFHKLPVTRQKARVRSLR